MGDVPHHSAPSTARPPTYTRSTPQRRAGSGGDVNAVCAVYRPRRPTATALYRVVQHHLNTFLARAEEGTVPRLSHWAEKEFRQYLTCGILAFGFARARCGDCRQERLVAFGCKGRGVCPSCTNRRMAEVSAHLCDRVIPEVPVRQWVLSVPKRLRPHLAGDADLAGAVLRILPRVIEGVLRESAREAPPDEARLGAVSFLHRFGSGLNPHPHFHLAVTDGLFTQKDRGRWWIAQPDRLRAWIFRLPAACDTHLAGCGNVCGWVDVTDAFGYVGTG